MLNPSRSSWAKIAPFLLLFTIGCSRQGIEHGMEEQPKLKPLGECEFFTDGRASRSLIPGTVARGDLREDTLLYTGKINGKDSGIFPYPITLPILQRGRERYDIYCAVCHDRVGTGNGMIVRRGFQHPPSYHTDALRQTPPGHIFDVITNGFGGMYPYADRIPVNDRWAIVGYVRALQLSQNARIQNVPKDKKVLLQEKQ